MKKTILTILVATAILSSFAQDIPKAKPDSASFFNLSLEELLNVEISVASHKALTQRESPGIVTLITQDEIRNSGAHDLMDVLRMVPGLHFGVDVEGVAGIGVRGNWGHEGKVLMLYDGQEMNEPLFGSLQFGEHYPVDQIKKIEIIRGPGSSVYGGNAEYAVINIVTRNNPEFEGIAASTSYGQMMRTFSARSVSLSGGKHFGKLAMNVGAYAGEGTRSDRKFVDYFGSEYDMASQSALRNYQVNANTNFAGLNFRFLGDYYLIENRDGYDRQLAQSEHVHFNSTFFSLQYDWKICGKLSLVPQLKYVVREPWLVSGDVSPDDLEYNKESKKPSAEITAHYDVCPNLNLAAGAVYDVDRATDRTGLTNFANGKPETEYHNTAVYMQGLWNTKLANLTLGARYHLNNAYDPCFVPRIGITRVFRKSHIKLLYSMAYRTPSIENIRLGENIQPEHTNVAEVETGFQVSEHTYFTANVFDITTTDAILYFYENESEGYRNSGRTGTRGVELDYKIKSEFGYTDLNMAYYTAKGKNASENYTVPGNENQLLAFPGLSVNLLLNLNLSRTVSLNPSFSWRGSCYGITGHDEAGNPVYERQQPELLANIFATINHLGASGFSMSAGCANLLDEENAIMQPYNSNHAPIPGRSREFRVTLHYELEYNK